MGGKRGSGEGCGGFLSSFTEVRRATGSPHITTFTFIQLILLNPFCLILLMAKGEQWITVSKGTIPSSCHYTESNYINCLVPAAQVSYHHPQFFLHCSIFTLHTLTKFVSFYPRPAILTGLLFQIHTDAIFK